MKRFVSNTVDFTADDVEALHYLVVSIDVRPRNATQATLMERAVRAVERVLAPSRFLERSIAELKVELGRAQQARNWDKCREIDAKLRELGDAPEVAA